MVFSIEIEFYLYFSFMPNIMKTLSINIISLIFLSHLFSCQPHITGQAQNHRHHDDSIKVIVQHKYADAIELITPEQTQMQQHSVDSFKDAIEQKYVTENDLKEDRRQLQNLHARFGE